MLFNKCTEPWDLESRDLYQKNIQINISDISVYSCLNSKFHYNLGVMIDDNIVPYQSK